MATYRLLQPHFIANRYLEEGTIVSDSGQDPLIPVGWIPTPVVEPLTDDALGAFHAAGPRLEEATLMRTAYTGQHVFPPSVYWQKVPESSDWILTGAGSVLGPKQVKGDLE